MASVPLMDLGRTDRGGNPVFGVGASHKGELILLDPTGPIPDGARALDTGERVRLAEISPQRPALVVENQRGDYVIVVDGDIDLDEYIPVGPADAELLSQRAAQARFGRRDDDVLRLTPWAEEDDVVVFDPDTEQFRDVPLVSRQQDGTLRWERGQLADDVAASVAAQLRRRGAEPGEVHGVLTNPFGECVCVRPGVALLPHEDVRRQALLAVDTLLDGAPTLADAAARLRRLADRFDNASVQGWRLLQPVGDGTVFAAPARDIVL